MSPSGPGEPRRPPPLPAKLPPGYDRPRVEREFWPKLKRIAAKVPGASDFAALYFYMNSDEAPLQHKLSVMATLVYFIVPLDLIPDILGPLGYTDDVAVAIGLIRFIGSEVMKPYREYARKWLRGEAASIAPPAPAVAASAPGASGAAAREIVVKPAGPARPAPEPDADSAPHPGDSQRATGK